MTDAEPVSIPKELQEIAKDELKKTELNGHHHEHDEVSRTVSDTLAAEFAEYVTKTKITPFGQSGPYIAGQQLTVNDVTNDSNYNTRVEFGLKLGYTETQVQIALMKLGPRAEQNELLAELIKLGASNAGCKVSSSTSLSDSMCCDLIDENVPACDPSSELRSIVIDGSNVAMSHGNKEVFSCMGIKICVEWFKSRGHSDITVFVPMWRKEASRPDALIKDQDILFQLEAERLLVFTPSRNVGGRRMVCYDDRYIIKLAAENDGIVVSNDNYRDLVNENPEYKKVIEKRLLMYSFVMDRFMPPDDPLGRHGPSLDNFLRKRPKQPEILPPLCPYGKKCTYGNKCKYYHPERGNQPQKSVTERLVEQAKLQLQEVKARSSLPGFSRDAYPNAKMRATHTGSLPPYLHTKKIPVARTKSLVPPSQSSASIMSSSSPCGNHLFVAKKISDQDGTESQSSKSPDGTNCLHRKLQRQLTLNPTYDPRLLQMAGYQARKQTDSKPKRLN